MKLVVLSPEKELLNCEVTAVELPGKKGRFMVWPGHAPLLSSLQKGLVRYDPEDSAARETLPIEGGFVEIINDEITVCAG
jgi:F-type H+-transporting ATPase subunit epsilon